MCFLTGFIKLETGANVDRKRVGAPKVTTAGEDRHLIIEHKINRRKTVQELRAEIKASR